MSRQIKTPGVTETTQQPADQTQVDQTENKTPETGADQSADVAGQTPEAEQQIVEPTYDELKEQLVQAQNKYIQLFNDPDALQARLNQLKPELTNPNLINEMAKRPERVSTTGQLTEHGWLV